MLIVYDLFVYVYDGSMLVGFRSLMVKILGFYYYRIIFIKKKNNKNLYVVVLKMLDNCDNF